MQNYISVSEFAKQVDKTTATVYNWVRKAIENKSYRVYYEGQTFEVKNIANKICLSKIK